jgi:hypothetical protein
VPSALKSQSWIIGADGVRVPFRPQPGSPKDPYLYKSAKAAFHGRTQRCQARFKHWHHPLCHGRPSKVRAEIEQLLASKSLPEPALQALIHLRNSLKTH